MRLVISGWHGQLARALTAQALSDPAITAVATGRPLLDVRDPRSIERAFSDVQPDVAINTAAYTGVDEAEDDEERALTLNRDGARLFALAAAKRRIPVIHLSTHYVFDGAQAAPYSEADPTAPATVYGRSKWQGEEAVRAVHPEHIIVRTGWVFSTAGRNFFTRVQSLATATDTPALRMVTDQTGNPTHAGDLARVLLELARRAAGPMRPGMEWGTYHAAGSGTASWFDFASHIVGELNGAGLARATVVPARTAEFPSKAPRPVNGTLDSSRLRRTFDLELPPWQDGVRACVSAIASR